MSTSSESLVEVFRAHLERSKLSLAKDKTRALRELAELAVDVLASVPDLALPAETNLNVRRIRHDTREINPQLLAHLVAATAVTP